MSMHEILGNKKSPTSKRRYLGIEIEFLMLGKNSDKLKKLLVKHDLQWYVNLGSDNSVEDTDFQPQYEMRTVSWTAEPREYCINSMKRKQGIEMRILVEESEASIVIGKCCELIKQCKGVINKTCGLHVHVDMRSRDYNTVYNNLFYVQDIMFATQPMLRRKNKYCKKVTKILKGEGTRRYKAINKRSYKEHRTLEVRLHEPTLESNDIIMWTKFLVSIANMNVVLDKTASLEDLNLPEKLKGYLNGRIKRYA